MIKTLHSIKWLGFVALVVVLGILLGRAQSDPSSAQNIPPTVVERYHPAVGSWIGIAVQVCQAGVAPAACGGGGPAVSLFMTPTLTADGGFVADDTLTLQGPPFGPHTTAHGKWVPTSSTEFIADYVFMLNNYPPAQDTISCLRARWLAQVINTNEIVGYVNAYITPGIPISWSKLSTGGFPTFPAEALPVVTSPQNFYHDPSECQGQGCPLVFKFRIKRVTT
jgi:hypothetical protein